MKKVQSLVMALMMVLVLCGVVRADWIVGDPGCWSLGTNLNNFVGVALVSISVGIVLYSRRP